MKTLNILRLTIIAAVLSIFGCSSSGIDKKQLVEDLVFLPADEITTKYGGLDSLSADYDKESHVWTIQDGDNKLTCRVFYTDTTQVIKEIVRINGADFDPELFWNELGWEMPEMDWQQSIGKMNITGLYGIDNAVYNKNIKSLNITLKNPKKSNFGKRIK